MTMDSLLGMLSWPWATQSIQQETTTPAPRQKKPKTSATNMHTKRPAMAQRPERKCVADVPATVSTTSTDNVQRPQRREIRLHKGEGVPFGIAISRLGSSVYITSVDRGSPAWRVGLTIGDRIDIVNDVHAYQTRVSAQAVMEELTKSEEVELLICDAPLVRRVVVNKETSGQKLGLHYEDLQISIPRPGTALEPFAEQVAGLGLLHIDDMNATSLPPKMACKVAGQWFSSKGSIELTLAPAFFVEEVMYVRQLQASRRAYHY